MSAVQAILPGVRMFLQGTRLRTGPGEAEFTAVEALLVGGSVFDPVALRHVDIADMTCATLDRGKARERGMELLVLARPGGRLTCLVESRDLSPAHRRAPAEPQPGPQQVFYGLRLEMRAVLDTGLGLCALR